MNKFRELLKVNKPTLGIHLVSCDPMLVEVIGRTGIFDYIELMGEDTPWDLKGLDNFCRATELYGLSTMFKVDEQIKGFAATRAIGAGFESILFASCRSAQQAKESIALARAGTPEDQGVYGAGLKRFTHYDVDDVFSGEWVRKLKDIVCIMMIEKKEAMEQLDEILKVPGVDMIQFGPCDYSATAGISAIEAKKIEKKMIEKALAAGIPPRIEIDLSEEAEEYLKMGIKHFCMGIDVDILKRFCLGEGAKMKKTLSGIK